MNGRRSEAPAGGMPAAVFLGKDGALIEDQPGSADPARVVLLDGAGTALRRLQARGFALVVVSNQAGVAHGLFAEGDLDQMRLRVGTLLRAEGVRLAGFYCCPHDPGGRVARYALHCGCRKPQPGMLLAAARSLRLDVARSWLVGAMLDDVEAGHRAGCRSILLANGCETEGRDGPGRRPDHTAGSLDEAASIIVAAAGAHARGALGTACRRPAEGSPAQAAERCVPADGAALAGWAERRRWVRPAMRSRAGP